MNAILTKLLLLLSTKPNSVVEDLLPGLPKESVSEKLVDVIKTAPEDLVELYSWKNGTQFPGKSSVFFDYVFHMCNLELAIEHYEAFQNLDLDLNFGVSFETLFPIFLSGGGEYYFYCFSGSDKGKVCYNSPGAFFGETVVAFTSLEQMFISIFECYDRNVFHPEEDGDMKVDAEQYRDLMKSLNPDCQKWNGKEIDSELMFIDFGK